LSRAPGGSSGWPDDSRDGASGSSRAAGSPEKRPRWGLRTLGFLGLALLSLVTATSTGHYTLGSFSSLLFGLIGAAYCSVKGLRTVPDNHLFRMLVPRGRPR
jgi:peptidoglycan/LPS O-acetylase OafA/YrhL